MLATWIETAAKGRQGGPVRAGMWSSVVIRSHPVQDHQRAWLELTVGDLGLGLLPAYWIENSAGNSYWHAPVPPQAVGVRLHYRAIIERDGGECAQSAFQDTIVRPNLPDQSEASDSSVPIAEGLVGNRLMTGRVDERGSTYDVYFPTVGLHSFVRPREGDNPRSRTHFRSIIGGLAIRRRLDWFNERGAWDSFQQYQGATNLLTTKLTWRYGPIQVLVTDFVAMGECLPLNAGREKSPGQYIKRFFIKNEGDEPETGVFGVYVQAEINGGVGDLGLSWHDIDKALLAINRGHAHSNRKMARDATIEFALALDGRGGVECEPTGSNEAILYRAIDLPARQTVSIDLLVSGAFTGWSGDRGTYEHWLRPALYWFRSANLDLVEQATAQEWDEYVEPIPDLQFPKPAHAVSMRRSALAAALHADAEWGAIASGFDRGLSAYCWPREAIWVGGALGRLGHPVVERGVYHWLNRVRHRHRPFLYWFQKYSIDGVPEWETPAIDQTAMIPWGLERYYRRTGDRDLVAAVWPMVEQAAKVCCGHASGHPGLRMLDDLNLITSAGCGDQLFGAFLYSNASGVAGLRAAARLAADLGFEESASIWTACADRIWDQGILGEVVAGRPDSPGLVDPDTGRFIHARRVSKLRGLWTANPEFLIDRSAILDVNMLSLAVPFGLLPASDPRLVKTAETILRLNGALKGDPNVLACTTFEPEQAGRGGSSNGQHEVSSLATLWMARFLIQLGRDTGQGRHWTRALSMLEAILARLSQLGLSLRSSGRGVESARRVSNPGGTAWRLHAMIIETMLDLAGLEYDAVSRRLSLSPILPGSWPQTGIKRLYPCGEVSYQLHRPIGGKVHHLQLKTRLAHPVELQVDLTCPDLRELGPWQSSASLSEPTFDGRTGHLAWRMTLPANDGEWSWTWG
ncbi:MAG: glycosyl hydrolase [Isosphaeraceae bacterium]